MFFSIVNIVIMTENVHNRLDLDKLCVNKNKMLVKFWELEFILKVED